MLPPLPPSGHTSSSAEPGAPQPWSPLDTLSPIERAHAVIDLACFLPPLAMARSVVDAAAARAADFLKGIFRIDESDQAPLRALQAIAADLGAGLVDARRLKAALDGLHRLALPVDGQARVALEHPPHLDVADPLATDASTALTAPTAATGTAAVIAADAVFVKALEHLHEADRRTLRAMAPADVTLHHGAAVAHFRLLALALRASLTGQPITLLLEPPPASAPRPDPPAPLLEGWHIHLAQGEQALRRMAILDLIPPLRVTRPSGPGAVPDEWRQAGPGLFASDSASFADELPLLIVVDPHGIVAWTYADSLRRRFTRLQRAWADLKPLLSAVELEHGRALNDDERRILALLMKEVEDNAASAARIAAMQAGGAALAREANAYRDTMRQNERAYEIVPLLRPSEDNVLPQALSSFHDAFGQVSDAVRSLTFAGAASALAQLPLPDARPMPALGALTPGLVQHLDRHRGLVRFSTPQGGRVLQWRVGRIDDYRGGSASPQDAWLRQDRDLRRLESFVLKHLRGRSDDRRFALPTELHLLDGTLGSGTLVLATSDPSTTGALDWRTDTRWRLNVDRIANVQRLSRPSPPLSANPAGWSTHGLNLPLADESASPVSALQRLHLIFQLEDSPEAFTAAWLLSRKHAGTAAWVQQGDVDQVGTVLVGRALLQAAREGSPVKVVLVGRSGLLAGAKVKQALAGWQPEPLVSRLDGWLGGLGLVPSPRRIPPDAGRSPVAPRRPRITSISLVSCALATPFLQDNFASRFVFALQAHGWAIGVPVTARTGEVHVTGSTGDDATSPTVRKLTLHVAADGTTTLAHQQSEDTVVMRFDYNINEVVVVDRYPAADTDTDTDTDTHTHTDTDADADADAGRPGRRSDATDLALLFDAAMDGTSPEALRLRHAPDAATGTALERAMARIAEHAGHDGLDVQHLSGISEADALADLRAHGLLTIDADGVPRLDVDRMAALAGSRDDAPLLRAAASLIQVSDLVFERLSSSPDPTIDPSIDPPIDRSIDRTHGRLLAKARSIRASLRAGWRGIDGEHATNQGLGAVNTVIGAFQLAQNWRWMSAPLQGLTLAQLSSLVVTPMTMKLGAWLSGAGVVARHRVLGAISTALAGGAADIGLSTLGLVAIGLQWEEFHKSGLDTDSFAYRSLVANTAMVSTFTAVSLAMSSVQVATAFAGGANAVAGTALGMTAGLIGQAAGPVALLTLAVQGTVNSFLWLSEYGHHVRGSTSTGDQILAGLALFFGFSTPVTRRAEVSRSASEAAAARQGDRQAHWERLVAFRTAWLAKSGYASVQSPVMDFPVAHASFKVPDDDRPYTFVLQDRRPQFHHFKETRQAGAPHSESVATAWIGLADVILSEVAMWDNMGAERQLFELQGASGRISGGLGHDRFVLDASSALTVVDGDQGIDEIVLDAGNRHVSVNATAPDVWRLGLAASPLRAQEDDSCELKALESFVIRNAASVDIRGGASGEHFDVAARAGVVAGGGGRNAYVLHPEVRVVSTSDDALLWRRGVSARVDLAGTRATSLLIRIDGLHEGLLFRRVNDSDSDSDKDHDDNASDDLLLRAGPDTLTLKGYFARSTGAPQDPPLVIVDALRTRMVLTDPRGLGDRFRSSASMDKHLFLDAGTPAWRRSLTGGHARTRHHLAAGAGAFRAAPRTSVPLDISLEVAVDRLRYRRVGDDLVIEEIPPADAPRGYTPLVLTLPGRPLGDGIDHHRRPTLWALADGASPGGALLDHPTPDAPAQGPMRLRAGGAATPRPDQPPLDQPPLDQSPLNPPPLDQSPLDQSPLDQSPLDQSPLQLVAAGEPRARDGSLATGTAGNDVLDAEALPHATALSGGEGSDTYRVPAGRSIVIDNASNDLAPDTLALAADPARLRFRRDGDDLVIDTGNGVLTLRGHAANPLARHLTLDLGPGGRYALPILHDSGVMVYGADAADSPKSAESADGAGAGAGGDVPAFVPGLHLVRLPPDAAWTSPPARPRAVRVRKGATRRREGRSLTISAQADEASSTVFVQDYYRAPHHVLLEAMDAMDARDAPDETRRDLPAAVADMAATSMVALLQAAGIVEDGLMKEVARIATDLADVAGVADVANVADAAKAAERVPGNGSAYDLAAVRTYFRLKGLSPEIADGLRSSTPAQIRRAHRLLAVAAAVQATLPAAYIDGFAASPLDIALSTSRHGPLLRHLAESGRSWRLAECALSHDLTLDAFSVLEARIEAEPRTGPGLEDALDRLAEFARLLAAPPDQGLVATRDTRALLEAVLRTRGRPGEVATSMAAAMIAVGTMDEDWIDGMQRAGVADHAVLKRLHDAKVPVQDVVLANAHRRLYEAGNRSALIAVGVSPSLRGPDATTFRYLVRDHLALDRNGDSFRTRDRTRVSGRHYDLMPGAIVDESGQSPDGDGALRAWASARQQLADAYQRSHRHAHALVESGRLGDYRRQALRSRLARGQAEYVERHSPWLPSVLRLHQAGLVDMETSTSPGADGFGSSSPANLVDGADAIGEATAWRPIDPPSGQETHFLQFDFAHAISLDRVELHSRLGRVDQSVSERSPGRWKVQARTAQGQWIDVSHEADVPRRNFQHAARIDTGGVPYRSYRLGGVEAWAGRLSSDSWFTEVIFTTAEAGASPLIARLVSAGYGGDEAAALLSLGLQTDEAVTRAIDLREHAGPLRPSVVARDVLDQPVMSTREHDLLRLLKAAGESPDDALARVRDSRSPSRAVRTLVAVLPHGRWSTHRIDPALLESLRPELIDEMNAWQQRRSAPFAISALDEVAGLLLATAGGDNRALGRAIRRLEDCAPAGRSGTRESTTWHSAHVAELTSGVPHDQASPTAIREWPVALAASALAHLAEALYQRIQATSDETTALFATLPLFVQLAAIAAVPDNGSTPPPLQLTLPAGRSARDDAIRSVMTTAADDLQQAENAGLLDVAIVSTLPPSPVAAAHWTRHRSADLSGDVYVSELGVRQSIEQSLIDPETAGLVAQFAQAMAANSVPGYGAGYGAEYGSGYGSGTTTPPLAQRLAPPSTLAPQSA